MDDGPLKLDAAFLFNELVANESFAKKLCREYKTKNRFYAFEAFCRDEKDGKTIYDKINKELKEEASQDK